MWKYSNTSFVSDSALEEMRGVVQTSQGLKEMYLLAAGGINCSISLYGIKNVRCLADYGPNCIPQPVWSSPRAVLDRAPGICANSSLFSSLSSGISCIRRIGRSTVKTADNISNFQHALLSTLGSGVCGGSIYVLNLSEPLTFGCNSLELNRRINKVTSVDCTIWTADTNCNSVNAAIGTNFGVSLINLETGRSSMAYPSKSDVLSQQFDLSGNILLCGTRKGAIVAIDVRQRQPKCFEVSARTPASKIQCPHKKTRRNLNSSNAVFMSSAVCSVVALQSDEQYFFGSSMNGSIKLFDRRFLNRDIQSYEGHVNSHSHIQLGVDPSETFVLSGGEDFFVRIWSIKTSELIFEENASNCIFSTVSWPHYGDFSYGYDQFLNNGDSLYNSTCSWGVWLGSREGLHYMRGA